MKITILSGGSGNDKLVRGLKKLYRDIDVTVIVNAYDNGKSTGLCRKLTDTLGVSDIRKNHSRMYEALNPNPDKRILEFYNGRYNFTKGNELNEVLELLDAWDLNRFAEVAKSFFSNPETKNYEFKDFSVANIIYAQMYKELGYDYTNSCMTNMLGLDDFVLLNSYDNTYIMAQTRSGRIIEDEGETVFYNNAEDPIYKTIYTEPRVKYGVNMRAVEAINQSDLIIISTGTFWSSIQPTIEYLDFYKYINAAKCKKIWVMNNEEDGDSWGISSNQFIRFMVDNNLDLSDFVILENLDARESLREPNPDFNIVYKAMGNIKGKHDPDKYARAILSIYYGIDSIDDFDKIIFDFDDTIWARDYNYNDYTRDKSIENLKLVNDIVGDKACIISGNSYKSIRDKLYSVYGTNLDNFNVDIWADANSTLYKHDHQVDLIGDLIINNSAIESFDRLANELGIKFTKCGSETVCLKAKPFQDLERKMLVKVINGLYQDTGCTAYATGLTTVDILSNNNTKKIVYDYCGFDKCVTLYIGDEIDSGNDRDISNACDCVIKVKDVEETNVVLKLLNRG